MNFDEALRAMRDGKRVARKRWDTDDGTDRWLALWTAGTYSVGSDLFENCPALRDQANKAASRSLDVGECIVEKTADGSVVFGWVGSLEDLTATDWTLHVG